VTDTTSVKTLGILLFSVALSSLLPRQGSATVYNSNGSAADVQNIHNTRAHNGDTITLPSGQFTWSTPVTISKAIKLEGAGAGRIIGNTKSPIAVATGTKTFVTTRSGLPITEGQVLLIGKMPSSPGYPPTNARGYWMKGTVTSYSGTTLVMNVTSASGTGTYQSWWIATQPRTTILNAYDNGQPGDNGASPLLRIEQSAAGSTELSGIRFVHGASSVSAATGVNGGWTGPKTLIHDCWFETGGGSPSGAIFAGTNQLLIWNCSFDDTWSQQAEAIQVAFEGNTSWSTNSTMGMADVNGATNLYVEDCDFHAYLTAFDFDNNSRVVFRHNLLDNSTQGTHGADTSTIGVRHFELYNNELVFDSFTDCNTELDLQWFLWVRGGTGVITDNILPRITSTCSGHKGNIRFSVLNTRRDSGPYCCWAQYPAPHQVGQGYGPGAVFHQYTSQCGPYSGQNHSYYTYQEPVYIWNNSGSAGNSVGLAEDDADECGGNEHVQNFVHSGRDYIIGAKPGYQKFTYPHPLRTGTAAAAGTLGNISTRSFVQTGNNVMIGGFIIEGSGPKTVIVRAIGPELTQFGVPNPLADPTLELHNGAGTLIASNNNWQTTIIGGVITSNQVSAIQSSGHAPTHRSESAIIATLQPGDYTAIVHGLNNTVGVALVEVYDLSTDTASILGNISTRSFVQADNNVMIGGFIIEGGGPKRVIVRAIGPELTRFGVPDVLPDPVLDLHDSSGALIASNNNWRTTIIGGIIGSDQVNAIQNSRLAPTQPSESAIIATLQPGNYTAIVRGMNNTTGVALVEVHDLQ
jgi:hypothetical protein